MKHMTGQKEASCFWNTKIEEFSVSERDMMDMVLPAVPTYTASLLWVLIFLWDPESALCTLRKEAVTLMPPSFNRNLRWELSNSWIKFF